MHWQCSQGARQSAAVRWAAAAARNHTPPSLVSTPALASRPKRTLSDARQRRAHTTRQWPRLRQSQGPSAALAVRARQYRQLLTQRTVTDN